MELFIPRESEPGETRTAMVPESAARLIKKGLSLTAESGIGATIHVSDEAYEAAGVRIVTDRHSQFSQTDLVLRLGKPSLEEVALLKRGAIHVSFLDPFNEPEVIDAMARAGVTAISMEMMPRSTRAQKMDAISSQANLAGYVAVLLAAERLNKILPMMMTPAGTIKPSRVFVIGAGVAGLQAIATAKRLGARVDAFDTRPVVKEQVHSLGARFVEVDLGETGQTKDGYAKELTPEQQQRQRDAMAKVCAQSDIVITTAKLFGRKAPIIVTEEMVASMQPGSVIVDLAVESGGNVEGIVLNQEVTLGGVRLIGLPNLEGHVPVHASQMYASNVTAFVEEFWNAKDQTFNLDLTDEILAGCVVTHGGEIVNQTLQKARAAASA